MSKKAFTNMSGMLSATTLATLAMYLGGGTALDTFIPGLTPYKYTPDEKEFLASLDANTSLMWKRRFQRGLKKTEREWVNARIAEMKAEGEDHGSL